MKHLKIQGLTVILILGLITFLVAGCSSNEQTTQQTEQVQQVQTEEQPNDEEPQGITPEMLATHNSKDDCWVGYEGKAYDVTSWLKRHPGGANAIIPYCGTTEEFTAAFNRQHGIQQDSRLDKEGVIMGDLA